MNDKLMFHPIIINKIIFSVYNVQHPNYWWKRLDTVGLYYLELVQITGRGGGIYLTVNYTGTQTFQPIIFKNTQI